MSAKKKKKSEHSDTESEVIQDAWKSALCGSKDDYLSSQISEQNDTGPVVELSIDLKNLQEEHKEEYQALTEKIVDSLDTIKTIVIEKRPDVQDVNIVIENFNYPDSPLIKKKIRELRSEDIGKLIVFDGLVKNSSGIVPKMKFVAFECNSPNPCGCYTYDIQEGDVEDTSDVKCIGCEAPKNELIRREDKSKFENFMKCEIEESPEGLRGKQPNRIPCEIIGPLTAEDKRIGAGDRVTIIGIYMAREKSKSSLIYQGYMNVLGAIRKGKNYEELVVSPEDEAKFIAMSQDKDLLLKISRAVAPNIAGHDVEKSAIVLQMAGGNLQAGDRRGNIHILLIGDPGCVVGGEIVTLADGTFKRIECLGKNHLDRIDLPLMIDNDRNDIATVFHKYSQQPTIEITTETGKKIRGTPNHPLLLDKNSTEVWESLDRIQSGDKIKCIPHIHSTKTDYVKLSWNTSQSKFGPKSSSILPEYLNEDLAGIMGYVLGDGWAGHHSVAMLVNDYEKDLIPLLKNKIENTFGKPPSVYDRLLKNGRTCQMHIIEINDIVVRNNLTMLKDKRIPNEILESRDSVISEFIAWLFEADGCVFSKGRGRNAIQLKSASEDLLREVQLLLLRFGIHSRIYERNLTIRRQDDIKTFHKMIGFRSKKKIDKLIDLVEKCGKMRYKHHYNNYEIVKKVEYKGTAEVFDVEVPETHRFICNGLISHNTGKSLVVRNIAEVAPHRVKASGAPTSLVGLVACVVKDDDTPGGFILEAGAAVLADGGLLIIDEFDKMDKTVRGAMHEIMEEQRATVSKANINTELNARCAVLAIMNPKRNRFNREEVIADQIDLPQSMLSRFDLIFAIRDVVDEKEDRLKCEAILRARQGIEIATEYSKEDITRYLIYVRSKIDNITISDEAAALLTDRFLAIRTSNQDDDAIPITLRQMEGMMRLSEACAKLRLSSVVEKQDAEIALGIITYYLDTMCMDPGTKKYNQNMAYGGETVSQQRVRVGLIGFVENNLDVLTENNKNGWIKIKDLETAFMKEMGASQKDFDKALAEADRDNKLKYKENEQYLEYRGDKKRACVLHDEYKE